MGNAGLDLGRSALLQRVLCLRPRQAFIDFLKTPFAGVARLWLALSSLIYRVVHHRDVQRNIWIVSRMPVGCASGYCRVSPRAASAMAVVLQRPAIHNALSNSAVVPRISGNRALRKRRAPRQRATSYRHFLRKKEMKKALNFIDVWRARDVLRRAFTRARPALLGSPTPAACIATRYRRASYTRNRVADPRFSLASS